MTVTVDKQGKLSGIPGWDGASCTRLDGGLTNRTWKVELEGRCGVLKRDDKPRAAPFNSRTAEAAIQRVAAAERLAPDVLFADEVTYFTAFVKGTTWRATSFDDPANLERVAATLRRLHALPLTGRTFDATIAAQHYAAAIEATDPVLVDYCVALLEKRRVPHNLCCCHNDLVAENLIATPDLLLLDWEYACDNEPLFDLATIVEHHELAEEQVERLLVAYFDGDGGRWRAQLQAQRQLYLALLWLWMAARPTTDPEELAAVGERVTSCS